MDWIFDMVLSGVGLGFLSAASTESSHRGVLVLIGGAILFSLIIVNLKEIKEK